MLRTATSGDWRSRVASALVLALALNGVPARADDAPPAQKPLHERIDELVESSSFAPLAPPASDADFLRRVYLDLNGTIPDAATARAFLDDPAPNKRAALVERLLARPQFVRHMANVFDVMLMERRATPGAPSPGIPAAEWQEYLRKSFADNKPLDQLAREILGADGVDPALRPAARFYIDRGGDPNLLARDVGRLFFGRDFQCAQCHDHPIIDDYLQADYYGLMAFVCRGTLFVDAKAKQTYYAEKADGEVNYKSVFTGDARDRVVPKMPDGVAVSEPMLTKDEQYVVAPAKDVRPVPKYSRRAQLAANATSGKSAAFNRNLANRLWAHMMGRGVVHPLDVDHSGNPAVQSQLVTLLADELVGMKFDAKAFLRELALSRAYGRSSETPNFADMKLDPAALSASLTAWNAEAARLDGELKPLQTAASQSIVDLNAAYEQFSKSSAAREAAEKARAEVKKTSDEISAALAAAVKDVSAKDVILKALVEARDKAKVALARLPEDKEISEATNVFKTKTATIDAELAAARKTVAEKTPALQAESLKLAETDKALELAAAGVTTARAALDAADAKSRAALEKSRAAKASHKELTARIADTQATLDCQARFAAAAASQVAALAAADQLAVLKTQTSTTAEQAAQGESAVKAAAEKAAAERAAAGQAWSTLGERATVRFTLAPLKPLSPEQLAWSSMQAAGLVDAQIAASAPKPRKTPRRSPT